MPRIDVLAISSKGGHWEQLMLLRSAFSEKRHAFVTTFTGIDLADIGTTYCVNDCSRSSPVQVAKCCIQILKILIKHRPRNIITTGAAPGLIAIMLGRIMGANCVWIDSVANSERLSMSGTLASFFASRCVTQWKHLAFGRVEYLGQVL